MQVHRDFLITRGRPEEEKSVDLSFEISAVLAHKKSLKELNKQKMWLTACTYVNKICSVAINFASKSTLPIFSRESLDNDNGLMNKNISSNNLGRRYRK